MVKKLIAEEVVKKDEEIVGDLLVKGLKKQKFTKWDKIKW
jgi:hypothetical protein